VSRFETQCDLVAEGSATGVDDELLIIVIVVPVARTSPDRSYDDASGYKKPIIFSSPRINCTAQGSLYIEG
jgi:hypothetical protein